MNWPLRPKRQIITKIEGLKGWLALLSKKSETMLICECSCFCGPPLSLIPGDNNTAFLSYLFGQRKSQTWVTPQTPDMGHVETLD